MSDDHSVENLLGSPVDIGGRRHDYNLRGSQPHGSYVEEEQGRAHDPDHFLDLDAGTGANDLRFLSGENQSRELSVPNSATLGVSATDMSSPVDGAYVPPFRRIGDGPGARVHGFNSDSESGCDSNEEDGAESSSTSRYGCKEITETHEPTAEMSKKDMLSFFQQGKLRLRNLDQLLLFLNTIPPNLRRFTTLKGCRYWLLFNRNSHIALYNLMNKKYGIMFASSVLTALNSKKSFTGDEILKIFYESCDSRWVNHEPYLKPVMNNCMAGLLDGNLDKIAFKDIPRSVRKDLGKTADVKNKKKRASSTPNTDATPRPRKSKRRSSTSQLDFSDVDSDNGNHEGPENSDPRSRPATNNVNHEGPENSDQRVRPTTNNVNHEEPENSDQRFRPTTPNHAPPGWPVNAHRSAIQNSTSPSVAQLQAVHQQLHAIENQPVGQPQSTPPPQPVVSRNNQHGSCSDKGVESNETWFQRQHWSPDQGEDNGGVSDAEGDTRGQHPSLGSHEGAAWQVQQLQEQHVGAMQTTSNHPVRSELPRLLDETLQDALYKYADDVDVCQRQHEQYVHEMMRKYQRNHATLTCNLRRNIDSIGAYLQDWDRRKQVLTDDLHEESQKLAQAIVNRQAVEAEISIFRDERAEISALQQARWVDIEGATEELAIREAKLQESERNHAANLRALRLDRAALKEERAALAKDREDLDTAIVAFENRRRTEVAAWEFEVERQQNLLNETLQKKKDALTADQRATRRAHTESIDKQRRFLRIELQGQRDTAAKEIAEQRAAWAAERAAQERAIQVMREEAQAALESAQVTEARARDLDAATKAAEAENKRQELEAREKLRKTMALTKALEEKNKNIERVLQEEIQSKKAVLDNSIGINAMFNAQLVERERNLAIREQQAMQNQLAMDGYLSNLQDLIFQKLKAQANKLQIPMGSEADVREFLGDLSIALPTNVVSGNHQLAALTFTGGMGAPAAGEGGLPTAVAAAAAGEGGLPTAVAAAAAGEGGLPAAAAAAAGEGGLPAAAVGGGSGGGEGGGGGH
jgi:hypothetical protein